MARKALKRRVSAAGGKRRGKPRQAAPRTAGTTSPPGTPPSPGQALPAVIPPDLSFPPVKAELALIERQSKQKWTGLPPKSKIRAKAAAIVALKIAGKTNEEIAAEVGLSERSLRQYLWIAGKNGWLTTQDPHEVAGSVLVHRAVSNLEELLHARNAVTGLPDKEVTLESLKGLGVFKDHSKQEAPTNQQANMLTINVVMPEGAQAQVRPGTTMGSAAYVEGEVVDGNAEPGRLPEPPNTIPNP